MTSTAQSPAVTARRRERPGQASDARAVLRSHLAGVGTQMGLTADAITRMAEWAKVESYRADQRICCPNDRAAFFHIVLSGSVRLVCNVPGRPQIIVGLLGPGRFFGLGSAFDPPGPRLIGAVAHEPCAVAVVSHDAITDVLGLLPARNATQLLSFTARVLSSIIYHRSRALVLSPEERLAAELRLLANDFGVSHPRGRLIDVPLRHADLAALAGCSRAHVTRALARLGQAGLIDRDAGRLVLLDPAPVPYEVDAVPAGAAPSRS